MAGMLPTTGYTSNEVEDMVNTVSRKMKEDNIKLTMVSGDNAAAHQSYFAKLMQDWQQHVFPLIDWPFTYNGTYLLIDFSSNLLI